MSYFGCATKNNKIKWAIFSVLLILGVVFFIVYLVTMTNAKNKYEECVEQIEELQEGMEQFQSVFGSFFGRKLSFFFDTPSSPSLQDSSPSFSFFSTPSPTPSLSEQIYSSAKEACKEEYWDKEWPKILAFLILGIVFTVASIIPLLIMLFLTAPPATSTPPPLPTVQMTKY